VQGSAGRDRLFDAPGGDATMWEWLHALPGALGDPQAWQAFRRVFTHFATTEIWQYAAIVGVFWGVVHVLLRKRLAHRLIAEWPRPGDVRREMAYSLSSLLLSAGIAAAVLGLLAIGRIEIYVEPLKHGLAWLLLSLPLLIVWQDFTFYCTHRLMHTRWMFRHVHGVHHRSRQPSPWAAYSMHPVEALVSGIAPLTLLLVAPVQDDVLMLFIAHQVLRNVHGHAAVETLPRGFARHAFWRHFVTTTHHHLHHETAQGNYGLWFTWWDRLFGTERADYFQRFDAATGPRAGATNAATETEAAA
jgi:lathosterol oxidase